MGQGEFTHALFQIYNLGTGRGYSVLEMIQALERVSGKKINIENCPRRHGDFASMYADPSLAEIELGWRAERGLDQMCMLFDLAWMR